MKKLLNFFKIPTDTKAIFAWLIKRLFLSLGFSGGIGFILIAIAAIALLGFMIGDYQGNGNGTAVTDGNVTLDTHTRQQNAALLTYYTEQGDAWQKGLTQAQIAQVQQQGVDLPGAVLLAIGKVENNMDPPNTELYYGYLKPQYTWQTFTNVTIRYTTLTVPSKKGGKPLKTVKKVETNTPAIKLISADTWDGTLTNNYTWVTTQTGTTTNGTYTKQIELSGSKRSYDWSRVWSMFATMPVGKSTKTRRIAHNQDNQDILAGLIGAVNYTVTDPNVQNMVSTILFPSGTTIGLPATGPVKPADGNTVHDVMRWKSYIEAVAQKYQVPAVLIAGVMCQESIGDQYARTGEVLTSPTGALGLMQVEPSTAAGMTLDGKAIGGNAVAYLSNPIINIELGSLYLSELYHQFNGNRVETESAYNAGPGAEWETIATGAEVGQNSQTEAYVQNIEGRWIPTLQQYFNADTTSTWA